MKSKDIAVCALTVALMFALAWMPVAAFLIPVLFISCLYGYKHSLVIGVFAGGVCLMYSFIGGAAGNNSAGDIAVLCAIMVIPRIFTGLFASLAFRGSKKVIKGESKVKRLLPYNIAASVGAVTNTALVVTSLALFFPDMVLLGITADTGWWILLLVGLAELVMVNLFVPLLCFTAGKALKLGEFKPLPAPAEKSEGVTDIKNESTVIEQGEEQKDDDSGV